MSILICLPTMLFFATPNPDSPDPLAVAPEVAPEIVARIERRALAALEEIHDRADFPGGSAALILPDGTALTLVVGVTDSEGGRPVTPADRLLSGSIGKTYVAAMALQLAAAGQLDLDRRAVEFFEGDTWFTRIAGFDQFTVRQLLRHESGLERYVFAPRFWEVLTTEPDKVWAPEELLAFVFDRESLFAPGEGWNYSDTNYIIVGMILEKVAGESMYDFVQANFLDPHKLRDTVPSDRRKIAGLIQGHTRSFAAFGLPERVLEDGVFIINPQFEWCGGGFCNTPLDLARWAKIYYSGRAFDAPYLDELLNSVPADPRLFGPDSRYGPGCIQRTTSAGALRGHDGVMTGYESAMGWFSDHNLAVAVQVNMDGDRKIGMPLPRVLVLLAEIALEELGVETTAPVAPTEDAGPAAEAP